MSIGRALHLTDVSWKVTSFVAIVVTLLYVPLIVSLDDGVFLLTVFVLCPALATTSLALLTTAFVMRKSKVAAGLVVNATTIVLVAMTIILLSIHTHRYVVELEDRGYWKLHGTEYEEALRSQPSSWTELSRVYWRSWWFVGLTDSWLVFDPSDRLGKFIGRDSFVPNIPCPVHGIEKMSKSYYVVYDDDETSWDYCADALQPRPSATSSP